MADTSFVTIKLSSHNINGFTSSKEFLHQRCEAEQLAIFAVQEHWLKPSFRKQMGINKLGCVHPNYEGFGSSAMENAFKSSILKGRPYGGTGFIFSKGLSNSLTPLSQYKHERVSVMRLRSTEADIIVINAYLPFYDTRNLDTQLSLYHETVGFIDSIMAANRDCMFILLADFNCNIYDVLHPFSVVVR